MHVCVHVCIHACMHVCVHTCVCACVPVCIHACMCVCMHSCMHVCVHAFRGLSKGKSYVLIGAFSSQIVRNFWEFRGFWTWKNRNINQMIHSQSKELHSDLEYVFAITLHTQCSSHVSQPCYGTCDIIYITSDVSTCVSSAHSSGFFGNLGLLAGTVRKLPEQLPTTAMRLHVHPPHATGHSSA